MVARQLLWSLAVSSILLQGPAVAAASGPDAPLATLTLPFHGVDLAVEGDHAYVLNWQSGAFQVVDIGHPQFPVLEGDLVVPSQLLHTEAEGGIVYFIAEGDVLGRIDVSNPAAPALLAPINFGNSGALRSFDVHGNRALIGDGADWARYLIDDPANPTLELPFLGGVRGCETQQCSVDLTLLRFEGDVIASGASASDFSGAAEVWDVDTSIPTFTYEYQSWAEPWDLLMHEGRAYFAEFASIEVFDVAAQTWATVATPEGPANPWRLAARDEVLYVGGSGQVHAYDVTEPASAIHLWSLDYPNGVNDIALGTDVLCVLSDDELSIVSLDGQLAVGRPPFVASGLQVSVSPNPSLGRTTLRFALSSQSDVRIEIFDMAGRRVRDRIERAMPSGERALVFDGTDLAQGVYFARVTAQGQQGTTRLTVVR